MLVALRALQEVPGMVDPQAARSAIAKIESAAGQPQGGAMPDDASEESPAAAAVREAVRLHHAVAIDYYSASHDTSSYRVVDPIRIVFVGDQSYLEAWCRSAEGVRLFRFDRIDSAQVLDEPSAPPPLAVEAGPDTSLFDADPSLPSATLHIAPTASWMFDYFPMRMVRELPDGSCEAEMTYASEEWMARLVLGFGAAVKVLAPSSLAAQVQSAATAALQAYEAGLAGVASRRRLEVNHGERLQPWHADRLCRGGHCSVRFQEAARRRPLAWEIDADLQVRRCVSCRTRTRRDPRRLTRAAEPSTVGSRENHSTPAGLRRAPSTRSPHIRRH